MSSLEMQNLQLVREELHSKKILRRTIAEYIKEQLEADLSAEETNEVQYLVLALDEWLQKDHGYESKHDRIACLDMVDPAKIVTSLLMVIAPNPEPITVQMVGAQLASSDIWFRVPDRKIDAVRTCCEIICHLHLYTNLYNVTLNDGENGIMVQSMLDLGEDIDNAIQDTMYPPPMLIKPKHRNDNMDSPYISIPATAFTGSGLCHHDQYINLRALNIAGAVGYVLDVESLQRPHNMKELDPSKAPLTYAQQVNREQSHWDKVNQTLRIAIELDELNTPFYFAWKYDSRGRMYPDGYHLTPNGDEYEKSCVLLADQEVPTGSFDW